MLKETRSEGPRLIHRISEITEEHINFIRGNGDRHIQQISMDYYKTHRVDNHNVCVECRSPQRMLLGLSFVALLNDEGPQYSITVVLRSARQQGIGESMLLYKKLACEEQGTALRALVSQSNEPSVRMSQKVFRHKDLIVQNDKYKYIFHD